MRMPAISAYTKTHRAEVPRLLGGLNLRELDYRLRADESPEMENLWWQDGVLQGRDGQVLLAETNLGEGFCSSGAPYYGMVFFHIGESLCMADPTAPTVQVTVLAGGVPRSRGSFFRYQEDLYYKNRGGFYQHVARFDRYIL